MKNKHAKWGLIHFLAIVMIAMAGSAFAAGETLMHNSNNLGTKYGTWGVTGGKYGQFTCTTCHSTLTAGTNNVKRVKGTITAPLGNWSSSKAATVNVVFNSMTAFGTDAGGHLSSTSVCQVCHSKTTVHRYNTTGQTDLNHQNANQTDCTSCHSHASAFKPSCNTCHGYPPATTALGPDGLANPATNALGASPAQPGAHAVHDALFMKCNACHNGYDATLHRTSGKIEIGFAINNSNFPAFGSVAAGTGSFVGTNSLNTSTGGTPASYSWQGNGGTTVSTAAGTTTCSVYCHGNWTGANGGANPSWVGGSTEKACGACHGASAAATPTTNAHVRHAGTLSATSLGVACANCHGAHPDNSHVNGNVKWDVSGLASAYATAPQYRKNGGTYAVSGTTGGLAPSAAFGQCNNVYCHSNVQGVNGTGVPTSFAQPTWSNASVACDSCHWATGGSLKLMSSGSHRAHVSRGYTYACSTCHNGSGAGTVLHADGKVQVTLAQGTYSSAGKIAGSVGYTRCSNTACHMSGKPAWGSTLAANCLACHGNRTSATLSGAHNKHLNDPNNGGNFNCIDCHATVVSNNTTISNKALHANSMINYSGALSGKYAGASPVTCSTQYCHTNGKGTASAPPAWTASFTGGSCNKCHGGVSSLAGEPVYASGGAGTPTANSHPKHVGTVGPDTTCQYCHSTTMSGNVLSTSGKHLNKFINVTSGNGKSFGYLTGTKTCSNISCHSGGGMFTAADVQWGSTMPADCTGCHGNEVTAATKLSGAHNSHLNNASAGGIFKCKDCHAPTITNADNRTIANANNHGNAIVNYSGAKAGKNKNCSNIYCHSNGKGSYAAIPTWTSGTNLTCEGCHATASLQLDHTKHIAKGASCSQCHNATTTNNTSIASSTHIDGTVNLLNGGSFNSKAVSFTPAGTTCNNISCHSTAATGPYSNTATWGTKLNCNACHPQSGLSGAHQVHMGALDLTTSTVYYNMTANRSPATNDTVRMHGFGCANCHPMNDVNHLNGSVDVDLNRVNVAGVSKLRFLNHSTAGYGMLTDKKCSNMYCHSNASRIEAESNVKSNTSLAWTDKFSNYPSQDRCGFCHGNQPTTGAHVAHAISNHSDNIYNGKNGKVGFSGTGNSAHGNPNTTTTITCYICHSDTVNPTAHGNDKNDRCKGCHGVTAPLKGTAYINNLANHVNGSREIKFAPIKVRSKAQVRPESFRFYSGVWKRTYYKNMTSLAFDESKLALDTATMWHPSTPTESNCTNLACHNGYIAKWNMANWNDPNKCMDCHFKL